MSETTERDGSERVPENQGMGEAKTKNVAFLRHEYLRDELYSGLILDFYPVLEELDDVLVILVHGEMRRVPRTHFDVFAMPKDGRLMVARGEELDLVWQQAPPSPFRVTELLERTIARLHEWGINPANSRLVRARQFYAEVRDEDLREERVAMRYLEAGRLATDMFTGLFGSEGPPCGRMREVIVKSLYGNDLAEDETDHEARNFQYELFLHGVLSITGFAVEWGEPEPDLIFEFQGRKVGVAVKRLWSIKQTRRRISEGIGQMEQHHIPGFVALHTPIGLPPLGRHRDPLEYSEQVARFLGHMATFKEDPSFLGLILTSHSADWVQGSRGQPVPILRPHTTFHTHGRPDAEPVGRFLRTEVGQRAIAWSIRHITWPPTRESPGRGFEDIWGRLAELTYSQAGRITLNPDKMDTMVYDDLTLRVYSKHLRESRPPAVVVLVTSQRQQGAPEMIFGLEVHEAFEPNLLDLSPIQILRLMASQFGCLIHLGREARRLYLCEEVPVVPGEPGLSGVPPSMSCRTGAGVVGETLFRVDFTRGNWQCAMGIAIDLGLYRSYRKQVGLWV